jgi:hypothetical protein
MPIRSSRRLTGAEIEADRVTLIAVKGLTNYTPINPAYTIATVSALETALEQARQEEVRVLAAATAARDAAVAAEWELHNAVQGIKTQVIAQYGSDSDAVHAIGLKKKSERKRPARRKAA